MDFETSDDRARIDLDVVWAFLSHHAYWGRWRDRSTVERQVAASWRVVGAYADGRMIGFGRAISDGAALAYLADVFVVPEARGHGVGKAIVHTMIEDGPGAEFRWMLHTADAHGMYEPFGFRAPDSTYLERPGKHSPVTEAVPGTA